MNGAESLVRTLVGGGVNVCFTNPGTSEMHFVAALDKVEGMRCVRALRRCGTGAADGYWRMRQTPAATLLHLGPGLGNGLANLHNAKKANSGSSSSWVSTPPIISSMTRRSPRDRGSHGPYRTGSRPPWRRKWWRPMVPRPLPWHRRRLGALPP